MPRLFFIDTLRIIGVICVLIHHLYGHALEVDLQWFLFFYVITPPFYVDIGRIGVWLFIFASGASLALGHSSFGSLSDVGRFYGKRLLRIYPIYWTGVVFSIIFLGSGKAALTLSDYVRNFAGFQIFFITNADWAKINGTYWFIGLIVVLYFLFPIVYLAIKRHPHVSLLSLFLMYVSSSLIMHYVFPQYTGGSDWFPLVHLFEFGLGIYMIQRGFYPKFNSVRILAFLGELSFYIYLVHSPLLSVIFYIEYPLTWYIALCLIFGCVFYSFDNTIQNLIKKVKISQSESYANWHAA
jgi:peptidoglycan/LPS O-acetylase OafA/YrhL